MDYKNGKNKNGKKKQKTPSTPKERAVARQKNYMLNKKAKKKSSVFAKAQKKADSAYLDYYKTKNTIKDLYKGVEDKNIYGGAPSSRKIAKSLSGTLSGRKKRADSLSRVSKNIRKKVLKKKCYENG